MVKTVTDNEQMKNPRLNPFSNITAEDWQKVLGQFVTIDRQGGGILEAAADFELVQELTRRNHPGVSFRTLPVTNFQALSPEALQQLQLWAASRPSLEPEQT